MQSVFFPSLLHSLMRNYYMMVSSSPKVRKRVECLRHLQSRLDELEAQFREERKALEAKYQKLYEPLFTERCEIVNGLREVEGVMSTELDRIQEDPATEEKGVPEFWLTAMRTHEVLAEEIKGQDEGALKFIKDIKCSRLEIPEGFKLEFYFNPNPYFKNSVLTKTYHIVDETDPAWSQAIGTEIEWYPGKCLTKKVVKKKLRPGSKKSKTVTTIKDCESFFTFFNPPQIPEDEDELDIDDAYDELQDRVELDYNVGIIIRDKIIPHSVSWFTGEAIEDDELDVIDNDDNDDDDEEDEISDDEDENNDNDNNKAAEEEEERKQGVEKDVNEDHDEDEDQDEDDDQDEDEKGEENKTSLKKDVKVEDEEEEEKQVWKKKIEGAYIQEGQKRALPSECKQQ